jgi:GNAT superfamily N-acetyltransferase
MRNSLHILPILLSAKPKVVLGFIFRNLKQRFYSSNAFIGFKFRLFNDIEVPEPEIPIVLKKLRETDATDLFLDRTKDLNSIDLKHRLECLLFIKADVSTGFVGVTHDGTPCVICWLIEHSHNEILHSYFNGGLPLLKPNDVLLEYVYTHPDYRGQRLMSWITKNLFKIAQQRGAERAIAFIEERNAVSIKAGKKIGWKPYIRKRVRWRLFRRRITYENLPR